RDDRELGVRTHRKQLRLADRSRQNFVDIHPFRGIGAGIAGSAVGGLVAIGAGFLHSVEREISQRIGANEFANLLHRLVGRYQLFLGRRVHSIEAGRNRGWARYAHVHFFCPRIADHAHDLAAGGAAHDGVVNQNYAFAFEQGTHRVQLQLHTEVAHALPRLDESTTHVVIANESEAKRNAALGGIPDGGRHTGVRHGDYEVGLGRSFPRQLSSQAFATDLYRTPEHHAVRSREINVLKNTTRLRSHGRIEPRSNT